jgi:hypothetical protein
MLRAAARIFVGLDIGGSDPKPEKRASDKFSGRESWTTIQLMLAVKFHKLASARVFALIDFK